MKPDLYQADPVEAIQLTNDNANQVARWCNAVKIERITERQEDPDGTVSWIDQVTLEVGASFAHSGSWIIRNPCRGPGAWEFNVMSNESFENSYPTRLERRA